MGFANYSFVRKMFMVVFSAAMCLVGAQLAQADTAIYNCSQLQEINNSANYELANDIDCRNFTFTPIAELSGGRYLNGKNFKIINLKIDIEGEKVGLFKSLNGATVKDLDLVNVNVLGAGYVGSIAGEAVNKSSIENVHVEGKVAGTHHVRTKDQYVGGLVGRLDDSSILKSSASTEVKGYNHNGGLAGINNKGTIVESFAQGVIGSVDMLVPTNVNYADLGMLSNSGVNWDDTASVNWDDTVNINWNNQTALNWTDVNFISGGLVGANNLTQPVNSSYQPVKESYSLVKTLINNFQKNIKFVLGGVIGKNNFNFNSNMFATGFIQGAGSVTSSINWDDAVGGLIGQEGNANGSSASQSYWDRLTTLRANSSGSNSSFGKTTAEMKMQSTYAGWNFTTKWRMCENLEYPILQWENQVCSNNDNQVMAPPDANSHLSYGVDDFSMLKDTLVVGDSLDKTKATNAGAVSIYKKEYDYLAHRYNWIFKSKLFADDFANNSYFGKYVLLSGDYLHVVAVKNGTSYNAYTYDVSGATPVKVFGPTPFSTVSNFNPDIDKKAILKNNAFAILLPNNILDIYRFSSMTGWTTIAEKVNVSSYVGETANLYFKAFEIDNDGNKIVLGDLAANQGSSGKVIILTKNGTNWTAKTVSGEGANFGSKLALDNNMLVVGSNSNYSIWGCMTENKLMVYKFINGNWVLQTSLALRGESPATNNGTLLGLRNGSLVVAYLSGNCVDSNRQPEIVVYRENSGKWIQQTIAKAPAIRYYRGIVDADLSDVSKNTVLFSEYGKVNSYFPKENITPPPVPDFTVSALTASPSPVNKDTTDLTVNFTVSNLGGATSQTGLTAIYFDGGDAAVATNLVLGPNTVTVPKAKLTTLTTGTHSLRVKVNYNGYYNGLIVESDYNNNTASTSINVTSSLPDFSVSNLSASPSPVNKDTTDLTVNFTVNNFGAATSQTGLTAISFDNSGAPSLVTNLVLGENSVTVPKAKLANLTEGIHTLTVRADSNYNTTESNENNNITSTSFNVTASYRPDLMITEVSAPNAASGGSITVNFKVKNQGSSVAAASKATVTIKGIVTQVDVPSMLVGAISSLSKTIPYNVAFTMGQNNISVMADAVNNMVIEGNESNNSASASVNVMFKGKVTKLDKVTPIVNAKVLVKQGVKLIATVYTNASGEFSVANLANPDAGKEYTVNPQLTGYTIPAQKITTVYVGEMKFNSTNK